MNHHKLRAVVEFVRTHGAGAGNLDEALKCCGLDEMLTPSEQLEVKQELAAMAEADDLKERLRLRLEQVEQWV